MILFSIMRPVYFSLFVLASPLLAVPEAPAPKPAPVKPEPTKPESKPEKKPEPGPAKPAPAPTPAPTPIPAPKPEPTPPAPASPEVKPATTAPAASTPAVTTATVKSVEKKKTVAEITKGHQHVRGLFDLYLDREKGTVHLYIKKEHFGREFIYFTHTMDGVVQAGHNRGAYGNEVIFRIASVFERVEFVAENTSFYFDPQNAISRAAKANISHAVLASEPVVARDEGGVLISAGNLFLKESLVMVKQPGSDSSKSVLGRLSETKSKLTALRG
jgi:hypothetical protein